ncbi:9418_t:CDS:1 [Ambispora gerdemannii]|uniref:9418_t:CDS:1 n=1 Tax=Ambispora gerdemannii TaxID=144530 RepID=A0A9N8VVA8_9GLOM|nr:9418_t:CDS:1 [Ambispora gerdemannii]
MCENRSQATNVEMKKNIKNAKNNIELSISLSVALEAMSPPFPPEITAAEIIAPKQDGRAPTKAPNNFLIYRKAFVKALNSKGIFLPMRAVSLAISKRWKSEPAWVKDAYSQIANEAGQLLNERHYGLWDSYLTTDCHIKASSRPAGVVVRPRIKSNSLTQSRLDIKLNNDNKKHIYHKPKESACLSINSMITEFNVNAKEVVNTKNIDSENLASKDQQSLKTIIPIVPGEQKEQKPSNIVESDGKIKILNQPMNSNPVFKKNDSPETTPPMTPDPEVRSLESHMSAAQSSSIDDHEENITCEKQTEFIAESTYNEFLLTEMSVESSAYFYNHPCSTALENFYFANEFSSFEKQAVPYHSPDTDYELDPLEGRLNISNLAFQSSNQCFFAEKSPCYY